MTRQDKPGKGMKKLKSYEFNGFTFKPGMKVVWNWTRNGSPSIDELGRMFTKITTIFEDLEGKANFVTDGHFTNCHKFETFIFAPDRQNYSMDLRPWDVRPYMAEMNGAMLQNGADPRKVFNANFKD